MLHNIESPYRAPAVRFFQRKNRVKKKEKGRTIRRREGKTSNGRRRRLKYFRGSRRRAIIEKGFHLASILAGKKNTAKSAGVARAKFRVFIGNLFVLIDHSYCPNFVLATESAMFLLQERRRTKTPAEKLRVSASFASTFTANGIMHKRAQCGLAKRQRARPRVRIYGTKIATVARKLSF